MRPDTTTNEPEHPNDETPQKSSTACEVEPPKIISFTTRLDTENPESQHTFKHLAAVDQESHSNLIDKLRLGDSTVEHSLPKAHFHKKPSFNEADPPNEQTINSITIRSNDSKKEFNREREYDQAQLEQRSEINLHKQVSSNSDVNMKINSTQTFNNKNEHTSSSLGKRNFTDFQNSCRNQASDQKKNTEPNLPMIEENEAMERVKKTPARRLPRGLVRTNSDNFAVEQVQQSGKKLINQDDSYPIQDP